MSCEYIQSLTFQGYYFPIDLNLIINLKLRTKLSMFVALLSLSFVVADILTKHAVILFKIFLCLK